MDIQPQEELETHQRLSNDSEVRSQQIQSGGDELSLPNGMDIHKFFTTVMDRNVFFQVTKVGQSVFLWIGSDDGCMDDLAFAAQTRYDRGLPTTTKIFGNSVETLTETLAARVSKKLKKPVYLSFNLAVGIASETIVQDVQRRLFEEIAIFPDKF